MRKCKNCGHREVMHQGENGECWAWNCDCSEFEPEDEDE